MAYREVTTSDSPNSGREKWNENDSELYTKVEALEDAPAEVLVQSTEPDPGECKLWIDLGSDPVSVNYHDGTEWKSVANAGEEPSGDILVRPLTNVDGQDFDAYYAGVRLTRTAPVYISGIEIRNPSAESYTASLYDVTNSQTKATKVASAPSAGTLFRMLFDTPVLLEDGVTYEIGYGSLSQQIRETNTRVSDGAPLTIGDGYDRGSSGSIQAPGNTNVGQYVPGINILYELP